MVAFFGGMVWFDRGVLSSGVAGGGCPRPPAALWLLTTLGEALRVVIGVLACGSRPGMPCEGLGLDFSTSEYVMFFFTLIL